MIDEHQVQDFLEHYGVRGMRWGVRSGSSKKPEGAKLRNFPSQMRQRNALVRDGKLTSKDVRKGNIRLGRNFALAFLGGAAVGWGAQKAMNAVATNVGARFVEALFKVTNKNSGW